MDGPAFYISRVQFFILSFILVIVYCGATSIRHYKTTDRQTDGPTAAGFYWFLSSARREQQKENDERITSRNDAPAAYISLRSLWMAWNAINYLYFLLNGFLFPISKFRTPSILL